MTANKSKWQAKIGYGGKAYCLGSFRTKEQAAAAHDTAARKHKGSDILCNFESEEAAAAAVALDPPQQRRKQ